MARLAAPRLLRGEGVAAEHAEPLYIRDKVALKICERA
jgi:tRNA threonylcarbamoyladenosine biosynthesis protein TsaB